MIFVTLSVVILTPMAIWQCVPISAIWSFNRGDARCLSISGVAYASAAVNIATEVIILILPVPLLRTLRTSTTQKIALYMLFGCGIIVIAVASARIPSLSHVEDTQDPTFLNAGVVYWTAAETAVAHLCAAALAIRPLYVSLRDLLRRRRARTDSGTPFTKPPGDSLPQSHSRAGSSSHEEHRLQGGDFEDTVFNPTQKLEADAV
ncbi:hypothetical protein N7488_012104 [Penicillium malachiteum]|nr:hypothetical protein N7488_012104 [Penicillium malachiteum]